MAQWMKSGLRFAIRYAKIYGRWLELGSYAAVGRENGVTGDRIRQICTKYERMVKAGKWREKFYG